MAPTPRAILLIALGAPMALAAAILRADLWVLAAMWVGLIIALMVFDLFRAPAIARATLSLDAPQAVGVGDPCLMTARVTTGGWGRPRDARLALALDANLVSGGRIDQRLSLAADGGLAAHIAISALRRGMAQVHDAWLGWQGPMGLVRMQRRVPIGIAVSVVPSIRAVEQFAIPLFTREAQVGQRLTARMGEGSEFDTLVRFQPGFDRRAIDWKQSARHNDIYAKQFESERDNRILLVIDRGRMMSGPVATPDGAHEARLDRAVSAALALGYVALRMEDRVSIATIAGRPWVGSREYARVGDFAALRRAVADIDYAAEETNFTLGLAAISAKLKRRAMLVIFTEFADAASAELMLRAAERLTRRHLLLFVLAADSELEGIAAAPVGDADALTQAIVAADLLRDRRLVAARLRQMGALVIEAPFHQLSGALLDTYIRAKRKGMV
ncbi:MAG: DUF58 domain-containing protein [Sphingomonadaceae bacterium]|nr:DUF58 domain-containing protein [Sphingomonadaceae bacterium]